MKTDGALYQLIVVFPEKERIRYGILSFCINENHALDAWFNKAYGGEQKRIPP